MSKLRRFMTAASGIAIFSAATAAWAQPEIVLLGDALDLSDEATTQRLSPWPAFNSLDDEFMVVWLDSRNPGENDIFGQRVELDGARVGENFAVIEWPDSQSDPSIAYNSGDNQFLVAWKTQHSGAFNHGYGRVLAADGSPITDQFFISDAEAECSIAFSPDEDEYMYQARSPGVRGQRIRADGSLNGANINITDAGAPAPSGQVAYNPIDQEFLFTWRDQVEESLKGRIYSLASGLEPATITISDLYPESGRAASVAFDPANERYFVVFGVFQEQDIYGQFVAADGSLIGERIPIAIDLPARSAPFMARNDSNGHYVVVWNQNASIVAQLVGADGAPIGDLGTIAAGTATGDPKIAANDENGEFLITWSDNRNIGSGQQDIFSQLIGVSEGGGGPSLALSGSCPGTIQATVTGATAEGNVALVFAFSTGSIVLPGPPCGGTVMGLDRSVRLMEVARADVNGDVTFTGNAPAAACGGFAQALDIESCETTNVAQLP